MGSDQPYNDIYNVLLNIKGSSSNNNVQKHSNRGRYVENSSLDCGKSSKKCGNHVKKLSPEIAEERANALISYFNAPNCRQFFLKCIYHLSDDDIYMALKLSNRPNINSPVKYFNKTCKQMMIKNGII